MTAKDLTGMTFGRLTVIGPAEPRLSGAGKSLRMERCRCVCGAETVVYRNNLTSGKSASCGCLTIERSIEAHGALRRDVVGYHRIHGRLAEWRGPASEFQCPCGKPAAEWAYAHTDPNELQGKSGRKTLTYSLDLSHYTAMCTGCHRALDREKGRVK